MDNLEPYTSLLNYDSEEDSEHETTTTDITNNTEYSSGSGLNQPEKRVNKCCFIL